MNIYFKTEEESYPQRDWHKWFAWHPVFLERNIVWLESVYRVRWPYTDGYVNSWGWKYSINKPTPTPEKGE